jgi:hypothetical protein
VYTSANLGDNNLLITVKDWTGNASTCTSVVTVVPPGPVPLPILKPNSHPDNTDPDKPEPQMTVHPNPTTGQITVTFKLESEEEVALDVFNIEGYTIQGQRWMGEPGDNTISLDLQSAGTGIYWIRVHSGQFLAQKRVMVIRN